MKNKLCQLKNVQFLAGIFLLTALCNVGNAQVITTIAGNGIQAYGGDGGPAILASFNANMGISIDAAGNLYIADYYNARIRMVNTAGIISTYAGNGMQGNNGDGGPATNARVGTPFDVTCTNAGVYICEDYNYIRLVDPTSIIHKVAGDGTGATTGDGGPAINAEVYEPLDMTSDANGNIYFADGETRIRMINTGGIISTIAGTGARGYAGDGGPATAAELGDPQGIAVDAAGNIYFTDNDSSRIRKISTAGIISTISGTGVVGFSGDGGQAALAQINGPTGIAVDGIGNLYFSDAKNYRIRKINTAGIITTIAGSGNPGYSGDGGPALLADMYPSDLAIDNEGNVIVSDYSRIRKICMGSSIYITVSPNDTICSGDAVTFTANTNNAGPSPTYQWIKNNLPVGNSPTYSPASISNGDVVKCVLTSINPSCSLTPTDTSNGITMHVFSTIHPDISITVVPNDTVCNELNLVTYTATVANPAPGETYQWYRNNTPDGTNSNTYTTTVANGDVVKCVLGNSGPCISPLSDTSNIITITVVPITVPVVNISANPGTVITQNQSVTFTATVSNGGPNPTYQWTKNGNNITGANQQTYTTTTLQNNDAITCKVHGLNVCDSNSSNALTMVVWATGVMQITGNSEQITVWPNPAKEDLVIGLTPALSKGEGDVFSLSICDVTGRELISSDWDGTGEKDIDIKQLASGVYMLKVMCKYDNVEMCKWTRKVVKE